MDSIRLMRLGRHVLIQSVSRRSSIAQTGISRPDEPRRLPISLCPSVSALSLAGTRHPVYSTAQPQADGYKDGDE